MMEKICVTEELPLYGTYDIVVVGAGPAGCGSALAAARQGRKTLLIERFNSLGGMWTTGFMNPLFDHENKEGIISELISELKEKKSWGGFWDSSFNYEYMKYLLDCKMKEAGVEVLLNTNFSKTLEKDHTVYGAVCENMDGRFAVFSKILIDCTGDGNAAASAGCEYRIGSDRGYKDCQAMTLMFLVGNIPSKFKDGMLLREKLEAVYQKAGKEPAFHMPYLIPVPNTHFGVIQYTHMYEYNPLSQKEINAATEEGRRQMIEAFEILKMYDEDFQDLDLIYSADTLGVRESRRIVGEYMLTAEDLMQGRRFYDGIAEAAFNIDIHSKSGKGQICMHVKPYQIPFRSLIPKGYEGILVAGRCISGDHEAMASYRVTGNCCQMGEAAGQYAAYAIQNGISVREVFRQ